MEVAQVLVLAVLAEMSGSVSTQLATWCFKWGI